MQSRVFVVTWLFISWRSLSFLFHPDIPHLQAEVEAACLTQQRRTSDSLSVFLMLPSRWRVDEYFQEPSTNRSRPVRGRHRGADAFQNVWHLCLAASLKVVLGNVLSNDQTALLLMCEGPDGGMHVCLLFGEGQTSSSSSSSCVLNTPGWCIISLGSPETKNQNIWRDCEWILHGAAGRALRRLTGAMRSPLLPVWRTLFLLPPYLLPPDLVCGVHFVLGSSLIALAPPPRKQDFNKCLTSLITLAWMSHSGRAKQIRSSLHNVPRKRTMGCFSKCLMSFLCIKLIFNEQLWLCSSKVTETLLFFVAGWSWAAFWVTF